MYWFCHPNFVVCHGGTYFDVQSLSTIWRCCCLSRCTRFAPFYALFSDPSINWRLYFLRCSFLRLLFRAFAALHRFIRFPWLALVYFCRSKFCHDCLAPSLPACRAVCHCASYAFSFGPDTVRLTRFSRLRYCAFLFLQPNGWRSFALPLLACPHTLLLRLVRARFPTRHASARRSLWLTGLIAFFSDILLSGQFALLVTSSFMLCLSPAYGHFWLGHLLQLVVAGLPALPVRAFARFSTTCPSLATVFCCGCRSHIVWLRAFTPVLSGSLSLYIFIFYLFLFTGFGCAFSLALPDAVYCK